ncbi:MAG: potassium transporter Kup [Thermoleophilia bacterium]|nr:potassium transporter Kup [Thermoleophilia bacterium]
MSDEEQVGGKDVVEVTAMPGDEPERVVQAEHAEERREHGAHGGMLALMLGTVGIVFGDIGTSPLYALKETFHGHHRLAIEPATVYGVLSIVFWSIMVIVSLKYVTLIMRADNEGEGGIMALISLVQRVSLSNPRVKHGLVALGIFGAALFYGDGMITPAISVLSAVEGMEVVSPSFASAVVPIAVVILFGLFAIQRFGTEVVGRMFGPVMVLWFSTMAILGLVEVVRSPGILRALTPSYGVQFIVHSPGTAYLALGSIVLAVTGAEALYADMGHFGRRPIQRSWFLFVLPALLLNYLGQGALLLSDPSTVESPFFHLAPGWLELPLVLLATLAAVIASQAVISGAFSVTRQAVQLGFLPRLLIRHTSDDAIGQVYVPAVNWILLTAVLGLVLGFRSSTNLASAYGIAVTGTLAIDTVLFFVVVRKLWGRPRWLAVGGAALFLVVDLSFFSANVSKIASGGWFPLAIGAVVFTLLTTWWRGRARVSVIRHAEEGLLPEFVLDLAADPDPPHRVRGCAIFLNASSDRVPLALRYNVIHNHVLHEQVLVVHVRVADVPYVDDAERLAIDTVIVPDDGIDLVEVTFGYHEDPDVPRALEGLAAMGLEVELDTATWFLSSVQHVPDSRPGMVRWRKELYATMARHATSADRYFFLPDDRVVSLGSNIEF